MTSPTPDEPKFGERITGTITPSAEPDLTPEQLRALNPVWTPPAIAFMSTVFGVVAIVVTAAMKWILSW